MKLGRRLDLGFFVMRMEKICDIETDVQCGDGEYALVQSISFIVFNKKSLIDSKPVSARVIYYIPKKCLSVSTWGLWEIIILNTAGRD